MYRILLIDDEPDILKTRMAFLISKGNRVTTAQTAADALLCASKEDYDCIVLDVVLSETTGFCLCDELKDISHAPIVFLSSLTDVESQMQGFSKGGADYITKDCDLELFWAKIKTRIQIDQKSGGDTTLSSPPLLVDLKRRTVTLDSQEITLTTIEFDILALIASKPNYIWSVEEIYMQVWGDLPVYLGQTLQTHMSRLRRKLEKAFPRHYFIETVWGKGYQFTPMCE
ncbi:MAG: response regulator transcription factor [Angelakisella sp.]